MQVGDRTSVAVASTPWIDRSTCRVKTGRALAIRWDRKTCRLSSSPMECRFGGESERWVGVPLQGPRTARVERGGAATGRGKTACARLRSPTVMRPDEQPADQHSKASTEPANECVDGCPQEAGRAILEPATVADRERELVRALQRADAQARALFSP